MLWSSRITFVSSIISPILNPEKLDDSALTKCSRLLKPTVLVDGQMYIIRHTIWNKKDHMGQHVHVLYIYRRTQMLADSHFSLGDFYKNKVPSVS